MRQRELTVGYAPYARDMNSPGDRRRFCFYASRRNIVFERADPRRDYDLIYLSTNADITAWSRYEGSGKVVFEIIDSYLSLPNRGVKNTWRGMAKFTTGQLSRPVMNYRSALEAMCRRSDAVVCSTEEQRNDLLQLCPNVHRILDVHEEVGGEVKTSYERGPTLNLVWEGLPYTLPGLRVASPALNRLAQQTPIALHLITDVRFPQYLGRFLEQDTQTHARRIFPRTYVYQWNPYLLSKIATACDLALIPLDLSDPFARGKPENKLLIFWGMGMPTITSATPAYRRAMSAAGLDMVCASESEWERTLTHLANDEGARRAAGEAGAAFVRTHHSIESVLERWDELLASVLQ